MDALRAPAYAIAPDAPHAQTMARVELPIWTVDEAQYQQAKEYLARLAAKEIPDDAVTHATALAAVKRYEFGQERYPVPLHAVRWAMSQSTVPILLNSIKNMPTACGWRSRMCTCSMCNSRMTRRAICPRRRPMAAGAARVFSVACSASRAATHWCATA